MDQVEEIQSHQSDLYYIVVNGEVLVREHPLNLYADLLRVVLQSAARNQHVQDIWISRTPCKACIEILQLIFPGSTKPTLHIETWRTAKIPATNYLAVLQGMGCISSLKTAKYPVESWDWIEFSNKDKVSSCPHYSIKQGSAQSREASYLDSSLQLISGLDTFCSCLDNTF